MRLLFVTQQVDPDHPALGATVPKIAALARRVDEVVVLADGAVPDALPANARVRTFRARTPGLFADADLLVNNMRAGAPDKVVYEAAASCLPVVASNPVFDELLEPELRFRRDDPNELAARLHAFAARDAAARRELGRRLREHVAAHHSAD